MGEADIVNQIVSFVPTVDFSKTEQTVSLFETTIRYLGGMLSGYDFLGPGGPRANLLKNGVVSQEPLSKNVDSNLLSRAQSPSSTKPKSSQTI
jgi:mannosyl-oligosaccharide alpha-1,2-mannosidase